MLVLPNYCGYTNAMYKPTRKASQVLVGPGRGINDALYNELQRAAQRAVGARGQRGEGGAAAPS